jgi:hypothetical protein
MSLNNWFGLRCRMGLCECRWHDNAFGCGGKCVECGKVVGWMTRDELRAVADRIIDRGLEP